MPWSANTETGRSKLEDLIPRLAYHIHRRTLDPQVKARVRAKISRMTLERYSNYEEAAAYNHSTGPRRMDVYFTICDILGENPGLVLIAASVSKDYDGMLTILRGELALTLSSDYLDLQGRVVQTTTTIPLASSIGSSSARRDSPSICAAA
jgi:hypothetical protein